MAVGRLYADVAPEHGGEPRLTLFKVLEVGQETVRVEDEWGDKRVVNRAILEGQVASGAVALASEYIKKQKGGR